MRSCVVSLVVSLVMFLLFDEAKASEIISQFDVVAQAKKDASIEVTESIRYDFGNHYRHGIFRSIPVSYSRYGGTYTIDFRLIDVSDENGVKQTVKVARSGRDVNIRVGNPSVTVTGSHVYKIHYLLRRAVNFFEEAPEFYFNVTGSEWPVPIVRATLRLFPPDGTSVSQVRFKAFHGRYGSHESADAQLEPPSVLYSCENIQPGEDFTIVAGFPKGSMTQPTAWQELRYWLFDWWPAVGLPLISSGAVWLLWWNYGRDAARLGSIPVEWNPPTKMTPAEVGTLIDESCDTQDIIATLIDLAVRGHLKIKEIQKANFFGLGDPAYEFTKTDPPPDDPPLRDYEKRFLNAVFDYGCKAGDTKYLSDLKYQFYIEIPQLRSEIYNALTNEDYFMANPDTVRKQYQAIGLLCGFIGVLLIIFSGAGLSMMPLGLGLVISAVIIASLAFIMPARSSKGITALRQCLGFKRFVDKAEQRRIEVLVKEDPTIFGRLLPYAMVLGFADKWADKFKELIIKPPDWYQPYGYGHGDYVFTADALVHDIGYSMRSMESVMLSTPPTTTTGSGGSSAWSGGSGFDSGFSGGGFSGGGGGSW